MTSPSQRSASSQTSSYIMVPSPPHQTAERFLSFIQASPSPFHAVANAVARLERSGFVRLKERDDWRGSVRRGGRYFVTRNQSSIVAFAVEEGYTPGNGVSIVGCHTDSPCFKVRPVSKKSKLGYLNVGVETYGGGHWQTWLDRDLGLAGRVVVRSPSAADSFTSHLVNIDSPILRIPTLAVHLKREQGEKLEYNLETQMVPVLALDGVAEDLNAPVSKAAQGIKDALDTTGDHHPLLLSLLADSLSTSSSSSKATTSTVSPSDIHDLELCLYDVQPPVIGGAKKEFVFSARLDNLFSSWAAVEGICQSVDGGKAEGERSAMEPEKVDGEGVRLIALWDNEEIGSVSYQGAESNFLAAMLHRIPASFSSGGENKADLGVKGNQSAELGSGGDGSLLERTLASSFLLSCDMGHAVHPSFPEKHEENHRPLLNGGPAIKTNAKQRYASTSATTFLLRRIASLAGVPLQSYEVRNDMACGSTIGPLVSQIGLRTVDIGCPQLSMHSIREQGGTLDLAYLVKLFEAFFRKFQEVDRSLVMDE